jgi:hypothetical protein
MPIRLDLSSLSESKPHEYLLRFLFGGICTATAGLLAKHYGPAIGGLFLAFPAIFPAAASLIQEHEKRRKAEIGRGGSERGRNAAALDAFGATLGCLGLMGFAVSLWKLAPVVPAAYVLSIAFGSWLLISLGGYFVRQRWPHSRPR